MSKKFLAIILVLLPMWFVPYLLRQPVFEEISTLPTGERIGTAGAAVYLLDEHDNPISQLYHRYFTLSNGVMVGERGAMKYLLFEGKQCSHGYMEIQVLENGTYRAAIGASYFTLDEAGQPSSEDDAKKLVELDLFMISKYGRHTFETIDSGCPSKLAS